MITDLALSALANLFECLIDLTLFIVRSDVLNTLVSGSSREITDNFKFLDIVAAARWNAGDAGTSAVGAGLRPRRKDPLVDRKNPLPDNC
jgi:hypothetical protein